MRGSEFLGLIRFDTFVRSAVQQHQGVASSFILEGGLTDYHGPVHRRATPATSVCTDTEPGATVRMASPYGALVLMWAERRGSMAGDISSTGLFGF